MAAAGFAQAIDLGPEISRILRPREERTPDRWADETRKLGKASAERGEFRSSRAPYVIATERDMVETGVTGGVLICAGQSGKTDALLNIIGQRLDDAPTPILYVGPSKDFVSDEFYPRFFALLESTPDLFAKLSNPKKHKKTRMVVSGVDMRMGWAGSAKRLAGFPCGLAIWDERDQSEKDLKKQGDPLEMIKTRGKTFPGFRWLVASTITNGTVATYVHPETGLEHWAVAKPEDLQSATWKLWQGGTRHEFAWPCPACGEFWIPRFKHLKWPKGASPDEASRSAWMDCPRCEARIENDQRDAMIQRAAASESLGFVSPGEWLDRDGKLRGAGVESTVRTRWISGLASAWSSFGSLARDWVDAARSGDAERRQGVLNLGFAELYSVKGEAPKSEIVEALRLNYRFEELPEAVRMITAGVDVQKLGLYYVVRGWGYRMESWLLKHGFIAGETELEPVWLDLVQLVQSTWGNRALPIKLTLVDSGYKPGKNWQRPEHRVYRFARQFPGLVRPSKGQAELDTTVKLNRIDVTMGNRKLKRAVELAHVNTDWAKSWIYGRIEWPTDQPGGWHLAADTEPDYCKQIVAESRLTFAGGRHEWIETGPNHYLDCEVLALAAAQLLGVHLLKEAPPEPPPKAPPPAPPSESGGWIPERSDWFA